MYTSKSAKIFLTRIYGEDPETLIWKISNQYSGGDNALASRLYEYASRGWLKFASAILSSVIDFYNMPISCFLLHVEDYVDSLIEHVAEVSQISVRGGGVSGNWSKISGPGPNSPGPIGYMNTINAAIKVYRQDGARRGNYAAYMDVSHPSILKFITMRIPGGDADRKNLNLHHAVNISDQFMEAVKNNNPWNLICPKTNKIIQTLTARNIWELILETRYRTGEPYLNFIDTVNRFNPVALKQQNLHITCSNLCNEIHLPTQNKLAAVCCLSSLNAAAYREWKDTNIVGDVIEMLDNVIQYFIENAPPALNSAIRGAQLLRPLGLGVLGLAQLYQREMIPFDSDEAANLNQELFSLMKNKAIERSRQLANIRGEPPGLIGTGQRNSHLLAVAPTTNSATLLQTSPSIEPWPSNAYINKTKTGSILIKNPELKQLLKKKGKNTQDIWQTIIVNNGSVQDLNFLSENEKSIFKTAYEVDPFQILRQAADRQKYICQGQALTLFLPKETSRLKLHQLHWFAWTHGCKGMYYIRTKAKHKVEPLEDCANCQG